jgi:nickel-type superoxide dismutase maturation protease
MLLFKIYRVRGKSMLPLLHEGDFVFLLPWLNKPKSGKLVVVNHERFGTIIKRVKRIESDGSFWLCSDHRKGVQMRDMGCISPNNLLGRIVFSVKKP